MTGWDASDAQAAWSSEAILQATLGFSTLVDDADAEEIQSKRADERMAVEAILGEERVQVPSEHERLGVHDYDILIAGPNTPAGGKEDVRLRISSHPQTLYPTASAGIDAVALPAFAVVSKTLPSYLKLALTQHVLQLFHGANGRADWTDAVESGDGGVVLGVVEELEATWAKLVDDPPLLNSVMRFLVATEADDSAEPTPDASRAATPTGSRKPNPKRRMGGSKPLRATPRWTRRCSDSRASCIRRQRTQRWAASASRCPLPRQRGRSWR